MDQDTKLIVFLDSLGEDTDVDFARQMLEAHSWDLEAALLAVTGGDGASAGGAAAPPTSGTPTHGAQHVDADGYRAPMRTGYRDTLLGPTPEELMFEQAAVHANMDADALSPGEAAGRGAGRGGGSQDEVRRAMRASQAEYQRRADHQEQGLLAEAIQASQANYMEEEQRRTAAFLAADNEEQQLIAKAIEASFREQSKADTQYRGMLERATKASTGGAADAYPTTALSSTAAPGTLGRVSRPSRGAAAVAVSRPGTGERPCPTGSTRTAGATSPTSAAGTGMKRPADQRLSQHSLGTGLQSQSHSNGTNGVVAMREDPSQPRHAQQTRSGISAIPPSAPRVSRTSRTETGASSGTFRNMRNGSAKLHDEVASGIAGRASAAPTSSSTKGVPARTSHQTVGGTSPGSSGPRSGSQPQKPARPPPTQPPPPASSSGSYRSPLGTPPAVRSPPEESELFPKVAAGARGSNLRPLQPGPQTSTTGMRARTPPGAARTRTPPGVAPGQSAAVREAAEADRRRQEEEERKQAARAAAMVREEEQRQEERRQRAEERRVAETEQLLQQQREGERREALAAEEQQRRAEAEQQRRREEMEKAEATRQQREKEAEAALLQRERELRQREVEAAEAKAAAAEAEARRQEAEAEAKRREAREAEDLRKEREEAEERRREAESAAQPEEKEKEGSELVSALVVLRRRYKEDAKGLATCLQTLRTYINNLARNPHEAKFQRINCENSAFKNRIGAFEGATAVLQACGFEEEGSCLVVAEGFLKSKGPRLFDAVAKLDVLIDQLSR